MKLGTASSPPRSRHPKPWPTTVVGARLGAQMTSTLPPARPVSGRRSRAGTYSTSSTQAAFSSEAGEHVVTGVWRRRRVVDGESCGRAGRPRRAPGRCPQVLRATRHQIIVAGHEGARDRPTDAQAGNAAEHCGVHERGGGADAADVDLAGGHAGPEVEDCRALGLDLDADFAEVTVVVRDRARRRRNEETARPRARRSSSARRGQAAPGAGRAPPGRRGRGVGRAGAVGPAEEHAAERQAPAEGVLGLGS